MKIPKERMPRSKKNIGVIIIILIAAIIFITTFVHAAIYTPTGEIILPDMLENSSPVNTAIYPVRLVIPSINVNAKVQYVGITKTGNMATPNNFTDVGWYKYGTVPGMIGSAVIAGHLDNGFSLDGIFKHLVDLKIGDDIYILTADNKNLHFVVQETDVYPYNQIPLQKLFNRNDAAYLNLITCEGGWTPDYTTYDHRTVIYAKLES